ncbi:MAG: nicotinate (nicotinamide) nucleotide adenylyltransferase [Clostridiales bacterium]|nr:nicotinate (nicotinamide) nucleotide adenylyltransferase [Clostridiales bacterium]
MKIGIYGGSFNPPHLGHLKMAQYMQRELGTDKILIIPSNISPQKSGNGNIDPVHRINMCRLAFSDPVFSVTDMEIKRGGKSYTVDTLSEIRKEYHNAELFLFMGSDMLLSFGSWYKPDKISEMCTICAVSRDSGETAAKMREYAENEISGKVIILDKPPYELSSTLVRQRLLSGEDCSDILCGEVINYIKENKLYGQQ